MIPVMIRAILPLTLSALLALAACTGDEGDDEAAVPECIEYELESCSLLYPATYDQVWTQTLTKGCAEAGSACHAQDGAGGAEFGLTFVDPALTFEHLTTIQDGQEILVVAGDPLCSPLFVRLATDDPAIRMPPGTSGLSDGALCSIGTWIADGAAYVQP